MKKKKRTRSRWYPPETFDNADYAYDLALLVHTQAQIKFLQHNLYQATRGNGLKSSLNIKPLKLVDDLIYFDSNPLKLISIYALQGMGCYWGVTRWMKIKDEPISYVFPRTSTHGHTYWSTSKVLPPSVLSGHLMPSWWWWEWERARVRKRLSRKFLLRVCLNDYDDDDVDDDNGNDKASKLIENTGTSGGVRRLWWCNG